MVHSQDIITQERTQKQKRMQKQGRMQNMQNIIKTYTHACMKKSYTQKACTQKYLSLIVPTAAVFIATLMLLISTLAFVIAAIVVFSLDVAAIAEENWVYNNKFIEMKNSIGSSIVVKGEVSEVKANLSIFPENRVNQEVLEQAFSPAQEPAEQAVEQSVEQVGQSSKIPLISPGLFVWQSPDDGQKLSYLVSSKVRVMNNPLMINKAVGFPVDRSKLPSSVLKYTKKTASIITDDKDVVMKAHELAAGETDLYNVVFKTARWVETNTSYSLDSLTEKAVQNSSWVYENKRGVCDELATLFIAMMRSVGVPARYVSGVAYTNYNNLNNWGPHAWAEVYFPEYGWLPIDVSYKEYGYIDATHIVLKTSEEPQEASVEYSWKGYNNAELVPSDLEIKTSLLESSGTAKELIAIRAEPVVYEIGAGSYNLLVVDVINLQDYYLPAHLQISNTQGIKPVSISEEDSSDGYGKDILLAPGERRKLVWLLKLEAELLPGYSYTFPISIKARYSEASTSFKAERAGRIYKQKELLDFALKKGYPDKKSAESNIDLNSMQKTSSVIEKADITCSNKNLNKENLNKEEDEKKYGDEAYINAPVEISCIITNTGNTYLEIELCIDDCSPKNSKHKKLLGIGLSEEVNFTKEFSELGDNTVIVRALKTSRGDIADIDLDTSSIIAEYYQIAEYYHHVNVIDNPKIKIEMSCPESIDYREEAIAKIILKKESMSIPKNITVLISQNGQQDKYAADNLKADHEFRVDLYGKNLVPKNKLGAEVKYYDGLGRGYEASGECIIEARASGLDKLLQWFNLVAEWIEGIMK